MATPFIYGIPFSPGARLILHYLRTHSDNRYTVCGRPVAVTVTMVMTDEPIKVCGRCLKYRKVNR